MTIPWPAWRRVWAGFRDRCSIRIDSNGSAFLGSWKGELYFFSLYPLPHLLMHSFTSQRFLSTYGCQAMTQLLSGMFILDPRKLPATFCASPSGLVRTEKPCPGFPEVLGRPSTTEPSYSSWWAEHVLRWLWQSQLYSHLTKAGFCLQD